MPTRRVRQAFPPPGPIAIINPGDDISCVNVYDRSNNPPAADAVIQLTTDNDNEFIAAYNSGTLTAANATGDAFGVVTGTLGDNSPITIVNLGNITSTGDILPPGFAHGLGAEIRGADSPISIVNSGDITANAFFAEGIGANTFGLSSDLHIENTGDIAAMADQAPSVLVPMPITKVMPSPLRIRATSSPGPTALSPAAPEASTQMPTLTPAQSTSSTAAISPS